MLESYASSIPASPVAFNVPSPRRLHAVVNHAHALGANGVDEGDALEAIENALFGDGILAIDRASQLRAWTVAHDRALAAFRDGGAVFARQIADAAIAAGWSVYATLYATGWHAARVADDEVIVEAVRDALIAAGQSVEWSGMSPRWPVTRARAAQADDDRGELDSFAQPADTPVVFVLVDGDDGLIAIDLADAPLIADRIDTPAEEATMSGNLAFLRLATLDGEPVSSVAAPDLLAIEQWAQDAGKPEMAMAIRRDRLGMVTRDSGAPAPVDLWQRHEAPRLPEKCLPAVVDAFARVQAVAMGADAAGLAMSALAAAAAAIGDEIEIQVKANDPTWRESARLWVGLVGMPSTKKTPIMSAAMRPLRAIDRTMAEQNAEALGAWQRRDKKERETTSMPAQPRRVVEDATIEALQEVLKDSPHGVISMQDELSGWFGAMDKYSPGKGAAADRAFWLKSFNGGSYSINRIARGAAFIPNLSIGLLGGIQPEPLRKLAGDSVDDGLIQRFLPVVLRPATIGQDAPAGGEVEAYDATIRRLIAMRAPRAGNLASPHPLRFDANGQAVRAMMEAEHVELVQALETVSPKLAAHIGKHDGIFARLCLVWHCVDHADDASLPDTISGNVAERVALFMREFVRPSAIAFYAGMLGMSAGHEDLMALASVIVSDGLDEVTAREVQRSTRALRHVTADEARRLCEKLGAFGWLTPVDPRPKSASPRWKVVPAVHTLFAERGRIEADRRAAARKALAEAFGG